MDSEDDMHDANDAESMDDDYYSGDTAVEYSDDDDDDGGDYEFENDLDDSDDVPIATANRWIAGKKERQGNEKLFSAFELTVLIAYLGLLNGKWLIAVIGSSSVYLGLLNG